MIENRLGSYLKECRKKLNFSLKEVCQSTEIDVGHLSKIENGKRNPTAEQIKILSELYQESPDEIKIASSIDEITKILYSQPDQALKIIKEINSLYKKPDFTFIDLFAGIGGFHMAMHSVGGKCVFASEIDKFARKTYKENYSAYYPELFENGLFNEDIRDPDLDYKSIPDFDVLCAGFPCQAFSHAGLKKGFGDTRGTLFFNIEQIVKEKIEAFNAGLAGKMPAVLFLENVKGLKNHDKGFTYETIKGTLTGKLKTKEGGRLNYEVTERILNSKYFGVPQNRERIFIIAWNRDLIPLKEEEFEFPLGIDERGDHIKDKSLLETEARKVCVGDILLSDEELNHLEREEGRSYTISDKLWAGHQRRRKEHARKGNGFGYSLFKDDSPYTSTISARYYKDGSEILIDQSHLEKNPRKLHPIEAARLQGYPHWDHLTKDEQFKIPVSNNQAYKQFGNSVSVPVIKAISKEIKAQLLSSIRK